MAWYIRLTWTKAQSGYDGDGFRIYVSTNGGAYSLVTSVPLSQTQYDYAISPGRRYRFRVTEYKNRYIQGQTYVYESPPAETSPIGVPGTVSFARVHPISTTQGTLRACIGAHTPTARFEKYEGGSWVLVATKNNLIHTQGGALYDWTQWSHWGSTTYWQSSAQVDAGELGVAFQGRSALAPTNNITYLYDYYPYSVTAGTRYFFSIALKADPPTVATLQAYIVISGGSVYDGDSSTVFLTNTEWRWFWFEVVPGATSSEAGIGLAIHLPRPHNQYIYAAAPFFGEAMVQSITIPSVWQVRVRGENGTYYGDWANSGDQYIWKKARLTWTEGNTAQQGEAFVIEKKVGAGSWQYYAGTDMVSTFDDTILYPSTTIYYRVYEAYGGRLSPYAETSVDVPVAWDPAANTPQNFQLQILS